MCETSKIPTSRRTARCSWRIPAYCTGISHPANGTSLAAADRWRSYSGVRRRAVDAVKLTCVRLLQAARATRGVIHALRAAAMLAGVADGETLGSSSVLRADYRTRCAVLAARARAHPWVVRQPRVRRVVDLLLSPRFVGYAAGSVVAFLSGNFAFVLL